MVKDAGPDGDPVAPGIQTSFAPSTMARPRVPWPGTHEDNAALGAPEVVLQVMGMRPPSHIPLPAMIIAPEET